MDWIVCLQCLYVKTLISNVTILGDGAFKEMVKIKWGFPGGTSGKESTCQCRRHKRCEFDPCVRKTHWGGKRTTTPVFLPGKSHGQRSLGGYSPWGYLVGHNWATEQQPVLFSRFLLVIYFIYYSVYLHSYLFYPNLPIYPSSLLCLYI